MFATSREGHNLETKSALDCEVCGRAAVYYSNSGRYKESCRCLIHKPSTVEITEEERYGSKGTKLWVVCLKGISLGAYTKITDSRKEKLKK